MYYLCSLLILALGTNRSAIDTQEKQEKAIVNKKKATVMRKLILKTAACLLLSFVSLSALADPKPPVPQSQYYGLTKSSDAPITRSNPYVLGKMDTEGNIVPVSEGPLTPATLVLLTLASGFAGVKIYRNNKEK